MRQSVSATSPPVRLLAALNRRAASQAPAVPTTTMTTAMATELANRTGPFQLTASWPVASVQKFSTLPSNPLMDASNQSTTPATRSASQRLADTTKAILAADRGWTRQMTVSVRLAVLAAGRRVPEAVAELGTAASLGGCRPGGGGGAAHLHGDLHPVGAYDDAQHRGTISLRSSTGATLTVGYTSQGGRVSGGACHGPVAGDLAHPCHEQSQQHDDANHAGQQD
jgi:hypothetical protein